MNDLEITKLCAEAMGYSIPQRKGDYVFSIPLGNTVPGIYWPLEDDAQAMALVKKLDLSICCDICAAHTHRWEVFGMDNKSIFSNNLNHAICECCAKMWLSKKG